jgi:hypothetical protein
VYQILSRVLSEKCYNRAVKQPHLRTKNPHEVRVIKELQDEGYTILKNGWPDFLAVRGKEARLVEVKQPDSGAGLSPRQQRMAEALAVLGLKVEVAFGSIHSPRSRAHRQRQDA